MFVFDYAIIVKIDMIFVVDYATIVKIDMIFVVDCATMPFNVDIKYVHCRTFNSIVVHSTMNVRQSIHFGLSIRHIHDKYERFFKICKYAFGFP